MSYLIRFVRFVAEYFVFVVGILFIFVIGFLYSSIKSEGIIVNVIFLIIAVGWIAFMIRYYWDMMEKKKNEDEDFIDISIHDGKGSSDTTDKK
jgi:positive regulator of sigma E activity